MVHESFQFQRSKRNTTNAGSMLQYFFERAEALGKLDSVLQLKLMSVEEKALVTFLKDSSKTCSQEVLLMYYLQRSRYSEAMHLNEQLNSRPQGFSSTRQAIMDRYSKANLIPNSLLNRYGPGTSLSERLKLHVPELKVIYSGFSLQFNFFTTFFGCPSF